MRSSGRNGLPFLSQCSVGIGFPTAAHRNFTVLAAGTAWSFFSIFSGEVQRGAPKDKKNYVLQSLASIAPWQLIKKMMRLCRHPL